MGRLGPCVSGTGLACISTNSIRTTCSPAVECLHQRQQISRACTPFPYDRKVANLAGHWETGFGHNRYEEAAYKGMHIISDNARALAAGCGVNHPDVLTSCKKREGSRPGGHRANERWPRAMVVSDAS